MQSAGWDDLANLLFDLRSLVYHPTPRLGLAPLDRLAEVFCAPAQTRSARPRSPRNQSEAAESDGDYGYLQRPLQVTQNPLQKWKPAIIQVTSPMPASGKTQLLYSIVAHAILPPTHGGQGTAVIWLDTDGRFSATRLRDVTLGLVPCIAADNARSRSLSHEALAHVHVFSPRSSQQLIDTLDFLPSYLLDTTAHRSVSRCLGLIALDSATAFYWQDRLEAETARFARPDQPRDIPTRTTTVITRLKKLSKEFHCAVAFSTSSNGVSAARRISTVVADAENAAPKENRSVSPWNLFATLPLRVSRPNVLPFAEGMSLEQCVEARQSRQDAVSRRKFLVEVDASGSDLWTDSLKEEWSRMEGQGSFEIRIENGVIV